MSLLRVDELNHQDRKMFDFSSHAERGAVLLEVSAALLPSACSSQESAGIVGIVKMCWAISPQKVGTTVTHASNLSLQKNPEYRIQQFGQLFLSYFIHLKFLCRKAKHIGIQKSVNLCDKISCFFLTWYFFC